MASSFNNQTPVGTVKDFVGSVAPSGYLLCYGQVLSTVTNPEYTSLYNVLSAAGFPYGGTNNTNFQIPDVRGRVSAGKDDMGGVAASRLTSGGSGIVGTTLGAAVDTQNTALSATQSGIAAHTHTNTLTDNGHAHGTGSLTNSGGNAVSGSSSAIDLSHSHTNLGGPGAGGGGYSPYGTLSGSGVEVYPGVAQILLQTLSQQVAQLGIQSALGSHSHTISGTAAAPTISGSTAGPSVAPMTINNSAATATAAAATHSNVQPTIIFNKIIKF